MIFTMNCKAQNTTTESESKQKTPRKFKLAMDTVSELEKKNTYDFAYQTFNNCESYDFPKLTSEIATERLVKLWEADRPKVIEACEKYNSSHGKLTELHLSEILYDKTGYKYFRYKASFSKTDKVAEIRVYTNSKNKLDGIIIRPEWKNEYSEWNENTKSE